MSGPVGSKTKKASGSGSTLSFKKDGYAKGSVPDSMIGTKSGVDASHPYTGPNVAMQERGG